MGVKPRTWPSNETCAASGVETIEIAVTPPAIFSKEITSPDDVSSESPIVRRTTVLIPGVRVSLVSQGASGWSKVIGTSLTTTSPVALFPSNGVLPTC